MESEGRFFKCDGCRWFNPHNPGVCAHAKINEDCYDPEPVAYSAASYIEELKKRRYEEGNELSGQYSVTTETKKDILVVVDMQNDFLTGSLANYDADRVKNNVLNKIVNNKFDEIIFTRDTHDADYLDTSEGKYLTIEHCISGTKGWCIDEDIMTEALRIKREGGARILFFDKKTFASNDLKNHIEIECRHNVNATITIVGVCTDICVVSNALLLKSDDRIRERSRIICDASCCSGVTKKSHEAALSVMKSCQIEVINE